MSTIRDEVTQLEELVGKMGKERKETWDWHARRLTLNLGNLPASIETVPSPGVADDWYGANYYWQGKDRSQARELADVYPSVRAVHVDALGDEDIKRRRTPSGWYPRVELTMKVKGRELVGDLDAVQAIDLALQLLAAARLVQRS